MRLNKQLSTSLLVAFLSFLCVFIVCPRVSAAAWQIASVQVDLLNIRDGPGTGYRVLQQAVRSECLPVLEQAGDWYRVKTNDGSTGWVAGWLVSMATAETQPVQPVPAASGSATPAAGEKTAVVTGDVLNVRSGPGTENRVTGQVRQGDLLPVLEQAGDWYRVKTNDGSTGWVAGWLVSMATAETQPVQPVQPVPAVSGSATPPLNPAIVAPGIGSGTTPQGSNKPDETNQSKETTGTPEGSSEAAENRPGGKALSLKVNNNGGATVTTVKTSAPFTYTSFTLSNPGRLVVDLQGIAPGDLPLNTKVNAKSLSQVRVGHFQKDPDITRLVFELKDGALYQVSLSADEKTLTVETYIPDLSGAYRGKVIVIDAGHGGSDPGAIGAGGTTEETVNLEIAKRLAGILKAQGAKVVLTRSGDTDVDLYERSEKANKAKADIFVSIHMNANEDKSLGGTSTYIYNGAGGNGNGNGNGSNGGADMPENNTIDQNARIEQSGKLAFHVQNELVKALGLRDAGIRKANFVVLRTAAMPAILAEVAFISNAAEEKLMRTDRFRNSVAEAIAKGIGLYFATERNRSH